MPEDTNEVRVTLDRKVAEDALHPSVGTADPQLHAAIREALAQQDQGGSGVGEAQRNIEALLSNAAGEAAEAAFYEAEREGLPRESCWTRALLAAGGAAFNSPATSPPVPSEQGGEVAE